MVDAAWDFSNKAGAISLVSGNFGANIIMPPDRNFPWNPGLMSRGGPSGAGIPVRNTIFTTLSPSGGDDTSAIKTALATCPTGQVVKLTAGTFILNQINNAQTSPLLINSSITLRGAGAGQTILQRGSQFVASISGTVMTVTSMSAGFLDVSQTIIAATVAFPTTITSLGTGTGGTGTYNVDVSQTVASCNMTAGGATSPRLGTFISGTTINTPDAFAQLGVNQAIMFIGAGFFSGPDDHGTGSSYIL